MSHEVQLPELKMTSKSINLLSTSNNSKNNLKLIIRKTNKKLVIKKGMAWY